ncbi:glycosyltransferase family 4 protein [Calidifontibacter indicus]|uniref:glycosyltransferase family 4 protein n=1 Tax=Calidifontibacter indicus TaxID=419650 RepID=UPI003D71B920
MKIGLIGGIYGMPEEFRRTHLQETTETVLERELSSRGHEVFTAGHRLWNRLPTLDVLHIHHLASSCVQLPVRRVPTVFTRHATKPLPAHQRLVLEATYSSVDAIVALSRREVTEFLPARHRGKATVIHNGINQDLFHPATSPAQAEGGEVRLLYVGQLIELKRVHLAIELLAEARRSGIDARLAISTQRPTLEPDLRTAAEASNVADLIDWLGPLGQPEVAEQMRASDMLVLPSRTEALSTVIAEAILSGIAVHCFDVGGAPEQLPSDWVLPATTAVQEWIALGVERMKNIDDTKRAIEKHQPVAAEQYDIGTMIDSHLEVYERISR